jgi:hypothetical protein
VTAPTCFLTDWVYEQTIEHQRKTWHLWECLHREGYTAYQLTPQPEREAGVDYVKPLGSSHFTSLEGLIRRTGMPAVAGRGVEHARDF